MRKSLAWICILNTITALGISLNRASAESAFSRSVEAGCKKADFKKLYEYQSDLNLLSRTDSSGSHASEGQGCQRYIGYQMAQYFEFQQGGAESVIPPGLPADCCENFRKDDQSTYALLQRLRNQDFGCESTSTSMTPMDSGSCTRLKDSLGKAVKEGFESAQTCAVSSSEDPSTRTTPKRALAPYNIEFLETLSPQKNLDRMREYFKSPSYGLVHPIPVGFSFCTEEKDPKKPCSARNSILVAGVRKACCKNKCQEEWFIHSRAGEGPNGWTAGLPLARSAAEFHGGMTQIIPCKSAPAQARATAAASQRPLANLPTCSEIVQGKYPLHYLAKTGDYATLKNQIRRLARQINEFDNSDRTPLTLAAIGNSPDHVRAVSLLLQNKADPNLEDASGMTPLHWALLNKTAIAPQIVAALVAKKAVFMNKDGNLSTKIRDLAGKGNPASREFLERKRKEFFLNLHR